MSATFRSSSTGMSRTRTSSKPAVMGSVSNFSRVIPKESEMSTGTIISFGPTSSMSVSFLEVGGRRGLARNPATAEAAGSNVGGMHLLLLALGGLALFNARAFD